MTPCLISYGNNAMQDFFYLNFLLHKNSPGIQTLLSISPELFLCNRILLRQSSITLLPTETYQSSFSAVPLLPAPSVRAVPASVFLMFWYFLKVVYSRACGSRGEWIKVRKLIRKLKMYKSLTFFLFNVRMTKRSGFCDRTVLLLKRVARFFFCAQNIIKIHFSICIVPHKHSC